MPRKPRPETTEPVALDKSANQSTQLAFLLIEEMADIGAPVALSDLARRLGIQKVRAFRYLRTLSAMGYVLQDPDTERYQLSFKLYHLAQALADRNDLLRDARPMMLALRDQTGFTVTLSQVEPEGMRILDMVRNVHPVEIVTRPGGLLDFHASAQGKVALAFGDGAAWNVVRSRPLRRWTDHTNTDIAALEAEVEQVRRQGWAEAPEQTLNGVSALSAPVFDVHKQMVATLTLAGPLHSLGQPPEDKLVTALLTAARRISGNLGFLEDT
ncbi:MAG: IclR family transcriptional regulator [Pararhodobacter sp.]|nr:IclR family transcriptional regulator [Pararhodobacter sp.]